MSFLRRMDEVQQASLSRISRILLASDGTLTDAVEAAMLEPIGLRRLHVGIVSLSAPMDTLDLDAGERIMERRILLHGCRTGASYVYAESALAVDRFPPAVSTALTQSDTPVGRLWSEHKLEGRKELLEACFTHAPASIAGWFSGHSAPGLVMRRYRMISAGKPLMLITEYFPATFPESSSSYAHAPLVEPPRADATERSFSS